MAVKAIVQIAKSHNFALDAFMTDMTPTHCLELSGIRKAEAERLAEAFDLAFVPDTLAVSITETDEATQSWQLIGYYADAEEAEKAAQFARQAGIAEPAIAVVRLPDVDWVAQSLKGLAPVRAGRFFIHGSHDRAIAPQNGHALEIDAGTAFGTGHHGTTRGCLLGFEWLMKKAKKRPHVLDVGCGTGVLGIAAAMALKAPVVASDIDPEAVRVSLLNARVNGVGGLLKAVTAAGTGHDVIQRQGPYDIIFANILAKPLMGLAPSLTRLLTASGHVILSGLTHDQERMVQAAYCNQGLYQRARFRLEGWSTLVMGRGESR